MVYSHTWFILAHKTGWTAEEKTYSSIKELHVCPSGLITCFPLGWTWSKADIQQWLLIQLLVFPSSCPGSRLTSKTCLRPHLEGRMKHQLQLLLVIPFSVPLSTSCHQCFQSPWRHWLRSKGLPHNGPQCFQSDSGRSHHWKAPCN